jgi:transposase
MLRCAKALCDWSGLHTASNSIKDNAASVFDHFQVMDIPQSLRDVIVAYHEDGKMSWRRIAATLMLPKSTVSNILRKYCQTGSSAASRKGNCGRRPCLTTRDERGLARASKNHPSATARELRERVGGRLSSVSLTTVKKTLRKYGLHAYRPRKSPLLTPVRIRNRLKWCKEHLEWNEEKWAHVSFVHF